MFVPEAEAFGQLFAHEYRVGDRVVGDDGVGGTAFGKVVGTSVLADGVLVRWDDEEYDATSAGHLVSSHWLRLWPASAQTMRIGLRSPV